MGRSGFLKTALGIAIAVAPATANAMQLTPEQPQVFYNGNGTVQEFLKAAYQLRDFYNTPEKTERIIKLDDAGNEWLGFDYQILSQFEERVARAPARANSSQTPNSLQGVVQNAQGQAPAEIYAKDGKTPLLTVITTTKGTTKEKDIIGYTNKGGRFY